MSGYWTEERESLAFLYSISVSAGTLKHVWKPRWKLRRVNREGQTSASAGIMNPLSLFCFCGSLRWRVFLGLESITALLCRNPFQHQSLLSGAGERYWSTVNPLTHPERFHRGGTLTQFSATEKHLHEITALMFPLVRGCSCFLSRFRLKRYTWFLVVDCEIVKEQHTGI